MSGTLTTHSRTPHSLRNEPRNNFLDEMENMVARLWHNGEDGWFGSHSMPLVDIAETDSALEMKLDLPGVAPKEIDIQLNGSVLTISGERKEEKEGKSKAYHRMERRIGSFSRTFTLPCPVEEDEVAAAYKSGVLTITLPKTEEAKTRKITIKS